MPLHKIAVLGLGKVGTLAAKLLHENGFDGNGLRQSRTSRDVAVRRARGRPRHPTTASARRPPDSMRCCHACPID